jgi:hypothetical protein
VAADHSEVDEAAGCKYNGFRICCRDGLKSATSIKFKMPQKTLREQVLRILEQEFPEAQTAPHPHEEDSILVNGMGISLLTVRTQYAESLRNSGKKQDMEVLRNRSVELVSTLMQGRSIARVSWDVAKPLLRPHVARIDTVRYISGQEGETHPHLEIGGEIAITLVLDYPSVIRLVDPKDLREWRRSFDELLQIGLSNLSNSPAGIEFQQPGGTMMAFIASGDGYAGARIFTLPVQNQIGEKLGFPFYFAIPYRDFLCCWPKTTPPEMQATARLRVASEFSRHDHRISASIFLVNAPGQVMACGTPQQLLEQIKQGIRD